LALAMVGPALALQKAEKKPPKCPAADRIERMLQGLTLSDAQKAKLAEVAKECGPKMVEANQKLDALLTLEQKQARVEAMAAAKTAGKKGKEMQEAVEAALKLTDDQKAKYTAARTAMGELEKGLREKVMGVLTPEQVEQVKKARQPQKPAAK
jgi:Spy/CpxP family protein refolding chaperone